MRLRVSGLRVSLAKLLRGRWDQGERDFMLLNEARQCLDLALETFGGLVLAAEDAFDTAQAPLVLWLEPSSVCLCTCYAGECSRRHR